MGLIRVLVRKKSCILSILFIWFMIGRFKLLTNFNKIPITYPVKVSTTNFYFILDYLSKFNINLLLIDPFLLDHLFIRHLSFKQLQKRLITFGIFNDSISTIHPLFSLQNLTIRISRNSHNSSVDHIFIEYNQHIIHLAILHKEKSYFLIQKNTVQLPVDIELSYGDTLRVIKP
jgi:hypothetical protein